MDMNTLDNLNIAIKHTTNSLQRLASAWESFEAEGGEIHLETAPFMEGLEEVVLRFNRSIKDAKITISLPLT